MEPTITLEFTTDTREHLKALEHNLKQIHGVQIFFVEPKDETAPVLISLGIRKKDEQVDMTIRHITHTLFDFVHGGAGEESQKTISLVTIEGERVDVAPLAYEALKQVITEAYAGQAG